MHIFLVIAAEDFQTSGVRTAQVGSGWSGGCDRQMLIDLSSTLSHLHSIAHRAAFMFGGETLNHDG